MWYILPKSVQSKQNAVWIMDFVGFFLLGFSEAIVCSFLLPVTLFKPMFHFYTPRKRQNIRCFLKLARSIKWNIGLKWIHRKKLVSEFLMNLRKLSRTTFLQATSGRPPLFFCISFWLNVMSYRNRKGKTVLFSCLVILVTPPYH